MRYRQLGQSDLNVSVIALGSWLTYGGGVDPNHARACLHTALDQGINLIDTANIYGRGAAEEFLGQNLRGIDRSSYLLASKLYFPMTDNDYGLSKQQIFKQVDASLQRLQTDYLDLYQCHRYDHDTPLEETMQALSTLVRNGKVRYIGFSEWETEQIAAATEMEGVTRFVSSQPQYSMLWRRPEDEVIPYCETHGIGQIVWSPLAQGVLSGKYLPGQAHPQDSRWQSSSMNGFMQDFDHEELLHAVQALQPIAAQCGLTMSQMALAWVLQQPNVSAAIVGASRPQQVMENVSAAEASLSAETRAAIDRALGQWSRLDRLES